MPVLISATVDAVEGWATLRFPYDAGVIAQLKAIPGSRWDKDARVWRVPQNSLSILKSRGLVFRENVYSSRPMINLPETFADRLRPYQIEAAWFLVNRRGALLTMDPRVGKTPTAIAAAAALISAGIGDSILVTYPNSVHGEWEDQPSAWANLDLHPLATYEPLSVVERGQLATKPYLLLGCHYEIIEHRAEDLRAIFANRRYIVIADELQYCKNRKIGRTKLLWEMAHAENCVAAWGLTGTPMRNRPRDLWAMFQFCGDGFAGSYWQFAKRYCAAIVNDLGFWEDKGESNLDELRERLTAISYRKTRREVAEWLPKADYKVTLCAVPKAALAAYHRLEQHHAGAVQAALKGDEFRGEEAIRQLIRATSEHKVPLAVERAYDHAARDVKVIVFAHFHETLSLAEKAFDAAQDESRRENNGGDPTVPPHFIAGGWMTLDKRRAAIERWRACPGPSILLANTMSSGIGIDLADAEVEIFLETEWVPADLQQAMDRIQDVHKGKRVSAPMYEFLLVKGTIDEAMTAAVLHKIRAIHAVVGLDSEARGAADALRGADVVGSSRLGLANTGEDAIRAALHSIRDRLLGVTPEPEEGVSDPAAIAAAMSDAWEDDSPEISE